MKGIVKVVIPGEPVAQGRPRIYRRGAHTVAVDPKKSRTWKNAAEAIMRREIDAVYPGFADVPRMIAVDIMFVFPLPKSRERKRNRPSWEYRYQRPDLDNLVKAVLDAGNGVLWIDDGNVVSLQADKITARQGIAPKTVIVVHELDDDDVKEMRRLAELNCISSKGGKCNA